MRRRTVRGEGWDKLKEGYRAGLAWSSLDEMRWILSTDSTVPILDISCSHLSLSETTYVPTSPKQLWNQPADPYPYPTANAKATIATQVNSWQSWRSAQCGDQKLVRLNEPIFMKEWHALGPSPVRWEACVISMLCFGLDQTEIDRQSLPFLTLFQPLPFHLLSAICKSIVATLYKGEVAIGSLGYEPILSFCFLSAMKYI